MPVFNYPKKEVNVKVVYYGPGLSGKTTNLQMIHENIKPEHKGKLVSLATQTDRTLFFDFMPLDLGSLGGYKIRLHLYTVPGQVHYNATRKLVLKGVDGVVFVADSQKAMVDANAESIQNLEKNLQSYGKSLADLPHVIQANKRDLDDVVSMEEIDTLLNRHGAVLTEAVASSGNGVTQTLTEIVRVVMSGLREHFAHGAGDTSSARSTASKPDRAVQSAAVTEPLSGSEAPEDAGQEGIPELPDVEVGEVEPIPEKVDESESGLSETGIDETVKEEREESVPELQQPGRSDSDAPVKIQVPLDGIGTVELSIRISARLIEGGQSGDLEVGGNGVSIVEAKLSSSPETEGGNDSASDKGPEDTGYEMTEVDPVEEEPPLSPGAYVSSDTSDVELPPLGNTSDEPLGAPLDGQEDVDSNSRQLSPEDRGQPRENEGLSSGQTPVRGPDSEYDPTVKPAGFDFSAGGSGVDEPRKKGFLGRFKKK